MNELVRWSNPEALPMVTMPSDAPGPEQAARLHENAAFVQNAYPYWLSQDKEHRPLLRAATAVIATALDMVDVQFGRDANDSPGPQYLQDPWGSFPTFYHGGDGTRLALLGCVDYMAYVNKLEGARSPYARTETYLASLTTAVFDDIVFGRGRKLDESLSAKTGVHTLSRWPFDFSEYFIRSVQVGVEESLFDEKLLTQGTGAIHADYRPVLLASQASDLWILFLESRAQAAMRLGVENMYKPDTAHAHGQILMHKAREQNFIGRTMFEFLELITNDDELTREYGHFMLDAADFGDVNGFQFTDERLNTGLVFRQARRWNSNIIRDLGENILGGVMTPITAYRTAAGVLYSRFGSGSAAHAQTPVHHRRDRLFPAYMQAMHEQGWDVNNMPALP
jgi:hypothetical protein